MEPKMKEYCAKCPHLRFVLYFSEMGKMYSIGCFCAECTKSMNLHCDYPRGETESLFVSMEELKSLLQWNGEDPPPIPMNTTFLYTMKDIPPQLYMKAMDYVSRKECLRGDDDDGCVFFVERSMAKWNRKK